MKPGIYKDISNADYHSDKEIQSKSSLDGIHKSAQFYKHRKETEFKRTPAMKIGTMAHLLVLDPDEFWNEYTRPFVSSDDMIRTIDDMKNALKDLGEKTTGKRPDLIDRLKANNADVVIYDDAKAQHEAECEGKEIITEEEYEKVCAIRDAVMSDPVAGKLFAPSSGVPELSCYWTDPDTGVDCRCRPDWWRRDGVIVDLKTARDADEDGFSKSIHDYRYHVQAAFYIDGINEALKNNTQNIIMPEPKVFVFVAVESTAPYHVSVYTLMTEHDKKNEWGVDVTEVGREEYKEDLAKYVDCKKKDKWGGYSDKVRSIALPAYRMRQEMIKKEDAISKDIA